MNAEMEGFTVLTADGAPASIPVVLLSAEAQVHDVRAGMDAGADDDVTEPFDLVDRVNALLGR